MACGRTVIVSDSGTLKELVPKGTEFVFPEKNAGALAERLTFLLDNADVANAMAKRGYERAHELFTIKKQAASILAIQ
jgi:glycosyltransferase involved in cell wall biosynthesis